jgi:hypothetical protein
MFFDDGLTGLVKSRGKLLGGFFPQKVFEELRFLQAGSSYKAFGFDFQVSFWGNFYYDLLHGHTPPLVWKLIEIGDGL